MSFSVLRPDADADRWAAIIDALPENLRDVHFTPQYAAAQKLLGVKPLMAIYEWEGYVVAQPFALRRTFVGSAALENAYGGLMAVDIANLYGYGGPVSSHGVQLYRWFSNAFLEWCRAHGVVSEYCALHPLMYPHQRALVREVVEPVTRKQVVVMDLRLAPMEGYTENRLGGIRTARRAGVSVVCVRSKSVAEHQPFIRLYRETMLRKRAAARWYFPDEYLAALCRIGTVFYAMLDGEVESASLVLHGYGTAYYHLTANAMRTPKARANDLLVHEIAEWARGVGCTRLHLGGGATAAEDDPVLRFKADYSTGRAPAYSYFRVFDDVAYRELCAAKAKQEIAETGAEYRTWFQPMYRREAS